VARDFVAVGFVPNPRRRLVACESGDKLHVALAHAAEIGPLPFPERLQLAACSSASSCDHMCNPSSFVSSFLACDGLGVISCALQLQCFRISHRFTAVVSDVSQPQQSRCIALVTKVLSRVLCQTGMRGICSLPLQTTSCCLENTRECPTSLIYYTCNVSTRMRLAKTVYSMRHPNPTYPKSSHTLR